MHENFIKNIIKQAVEQARLKNQIADSATGNGLFTRIIKRAAEEARLRYPTANINVDDMAKDPELIREFEKNIAASRRQMTEAELRSLFKEKKHEVPMMQKNFAQTGTMHLETMKKIAKDKGWSTERDRTPPPSPVPEEAARSKTPPRGRRLSSLPPAIPVRYQTPIRARSVSALDEPIMPEMPTRSDEQRGVGELLRMNNKKQSSLQSSLMDTINSIREEGPLIQEERVAAIQNPQAFPTPKTPILSSSERKNKNIDFLPNALDWRRKPESYKPVPRLKALENPLDKEERKPLIDKNMKLDLSADTSKVEHGSLPNQQYQKGLLEGSLNEINKPYEPYPGPQIAGLSGEEERAHNLLHYEMNPFVNPKIAEEEQEIKNSIENAANMPGAAQSANPYLKNLSKRPARMHEELVGPEEREQLASIVDESENHLQKLLPELKRKYMVPGLHRSGHMNKEVRDLMREYSKGRTNALNQAKTKNRLGTLGVAQNHASLQGQAANAASNNAISDSNRAFAATNMKNIARTYGAERKDKAIANEERIGMVKRGIEQDKLTSDVKTFKEAQDHGKKNLAYGAALLSGTGFAPYVMTSTVNAPDTKPDTNLLQKTGNGFASLGANMLNRKKGGVIKLRKKHADGGPVMKEAVENAVIDRSDPLNELRRLMNRQRMMDVYETKIGKRRYREGGQVNPITAGAEQARQFMGEKDLRAHMEHMKTGYQKPRGTAMIDSFMKGFGYGDKNDSFSGAYNESAADSDKKAAAVRDRKTKALEGIYNLDTNAKKELADLRKEEREEKKMLADEKKMLADERYHNATLAQTGSYHKGRLDIEREKLGASDSDVEYGDISVRKQTKDEKAAVKKANEMLRAARLHKRALAKTKGIEDVPTGPTNEALIKNVPYGFGYSVVSGKEKAKDFFGIGSGKSKDLSGEKIKDMEDRSKEALQSGIALEKALTSTGGRWTNMSHGAMESSKISTGSSPESNVEKRMSGEYSVEQVALESARMKINAGIDPTVVEEQLKEFGLSLKDLKPEGSLTGSVPIAPEQPTVPTPSAPAGVNPDKLAAAMEAERARRIAKRGGVQ